MKCFHLFCHCLLSAVFMAVTRAASRGQKPLIKVFNIFISSLIFDLIWGFYLIDLIVLFFTVVTSTEVQISLLVGPADRSSPLQPLLLLTWFPLPSDWSNWSWKQIMLRCSGLQPSVLVTIYRRRVRHLMILISIGWTPGTWGALFPLDSIKQSIGAATGFLRDSHISFLILQIWFSAPDFSLKIVDVEQSDLYL